MTISSHTITMVLKKERKEKGKKKHRARCIDKGENEYKVGLLR